MAMSNAAAFAAGDVLGDPVERAAVVAAEGAVSAEQLHGRCLIRADGHE